MTRLEANLHEDLNKTPLRVAQDAVILAVAAAAFMAFVAINKGPEDSLQPSETPTSPIPHASGDKPIPLNNTIWIRK